MERRRNRLGGGGAAQEIRTDRHRFLAENTNERLLTH